VSVRSGFALIMGRPNVGKSTLVNQMVGTKVSITSVRPNTTRHRIRGIVHRPDAQVVLVDTPGLHRPRSALGARLNETATAQLEDVDVVVALVDATAEVGPGDRTVLRRALAVAGGPEPPALLVAVNKTDRAESSQVLERLASVAQAVETLSAEVRGDRPGSAEATRSGEGPPPVDDVEYFPVSAVTGDGVDALVDAIVARLPEGPPYYPEDMRTDTPEALRVAELVREQLLLRAREELPHSIACRVTEWEWPRIRCEIVVERDSQKGIVIGRGGEVLKAAGTAVRAELPPGAYLELFVTVERHWQQRDDALDRLGY
jgi:GTP-binding protein Era